MVDEATKRAGGEGAEDEREGAACRRGQEVQPHFKGTTIHLLEDNGDYQRLRNCEGELGDVDMIASGR